MRRFILAIILILLTASLISCARDNASVSLPEGYTLDSLSGGVDFSDVNIKSITNTHTDDKTEIEIHFTCGSDLTISGEVALSSVPAYTVSVQKSPSALNIALKNVAFSDFIRTLDIDSGSALSGAFCNDGILCLQFKYDVAYSLREDGDKLLLSVIPYGQIRSHDEYAYYVTANLYEYVRDGFIPADADLRLSLTRSGELIYVSDSFATQREAEALYNSLSEKYPEYAHAFDIIAKYYDELPLFDASRDYAYAYSYNPTEDAALFIPDGFLIAETADAILYEKFISDGSEIHSEIYVRDAEGSRRYIGFEFESIETAEFSNDGKKLAVLENSGTGTHLYVFDFATAEMLYDLSDAGFGKRISGFAWNELGTAIYAIGGTDGIDLHKYDFTIKDETKRHSIIYSGDIDEGSFALYDGRLYFTSTDESGSFVHSLVPEIGINREVCAGTSFAFSGEWCAVSTANTVAQDDSFDFYIINMTTGEKHSITSGFSVYEYVWSFGGRYVYYIENRFAGNDDTESDTAQPESTHPYTVYRYDVQTAKSEKVCEMKPYSRIAYTRSGLAVMCMETTDNRIQLASAYILK